MSVVFTIKEERNGRWGVYRDESVLMKQLTVAAAIADARELARLIHEQSDAVVIVAMETPEATILLAPYAKPVPVLKLVAA
jgi:ABC-type uncharacterized transport system substrate-binding protein